MERELWNQLYILAQQCDRSNSNALYRDWEIVVIYFWAVMNDRPTSWATHRENWNTDQLVRLPDQSTISRRLRTTNVLALIDDIYTLFVSCTVMARYLCIDGKPLPVGDYSRDPDAKNGRCGKGFAKGYKLHAVWGNAVIPEVFEVKSMNVGEAKVARQLIPKLNETAQYVVGDKQYDSNPLHDVALKCGCQLIAEQKRPGKLGHCQHSSARLKCFEIIPTRFGQALLKYRDQIERRFGKLTCVGLGLGPLPAWVRRIHRVKLWVQVKLITNALHYTYGKPKNLPALA